MKAEDFDRKFDDGENIIEYLDLTKIKRSNSQEQTIAFKFPSWMVEALEQESQCRDLPLQAIVKDWIGEKLGSSRLCVIIFAYGIVKCLSGNTFRTILSKKLSV